MHQCCIKFKEFSAVREEDLLFSAKTQAGLNLHVEDIKDTAACSDGNTGED